jgi:hypothetical protein
VAERNDGAPEKRTVADRWWAEFGDKRRDAVKRPGGPAGMSFFRAGIGFEQERARNRLTDNNLKLLYEANPPEGGWGYVQLADLKHPESDVQRLKEAVDLPAYARGVVVDSGLSVRLLFTGTPIGQRILEIALCDAASFDCWVDGEWVREALFASAGEAVAAAHALIETYLSPSGVAEWEAHRARA